MSLGCVVSGGVALFLAITYSPESPENLGLLGFGGGRGGGQRVKTDS